MGDRNTELICDQMSDTIVVAAEKIATSSGAEKVTVRKILQTLGITNRVFYNRFHNVEEVLNIVYENTVRKIRASMMTNFDPDGDFFAQVMDIVVNTLKLSYENKMHFSQYVFENDSASPGNYEWWKTEIIRLMEMGKARGYIKKEVDSEVMGYAIWCFIRGYNADALGRGVPMEKAISDFRYSFGILLNGMKA